MKLQCFKCFKEFSNIESLCYHFKNHHGLKIIDIYKCVNNECRQEYSSLHRSRSHLKRHLSIKSVQSNNDNSVQNPSCSAVECFDEDGPSCSQNVVTPSFPENVPLITHVSIENQISSLEEKILSVC